MDLVGKTKNNLIVFDLKELRLESQYEVFFPNFRKLPLDCLGETKIDQVQHPIINQSLML